MRAVMDCVSDLYNAILKLTNNDTLLHNPINKQLSPLLQWKPDNLMEQLSNICVYIRTAKSITTSSYNITTNMDDEDDNNFGSKAIQSNNCSRSR